MERSTGLTLAVIMAVLVYCEAHGGMLHSASHINYDKKVVAGTCVDWVTPVTVSKLATGRRLAATAYHVEGLVNMTVRINNNCTGDYTSAVLINVTIADGSAPLDTVLVNGSVTTGTCASGGGDLYMLDPAKGMDKHNLLFFMPNATSATGKLVGSFANDGVVDTAGPGSAKSVVLYVAGAPISCCTLQITAAPPKGYAALLDPLGIKNCTIVSDEDPTNTTAPLGMIMGGSWMACEKVNGTYQMEDGNGWMLCLLYQNGTKIAEPLGMTMGGVWLQCPLVNGVYQMDHGSGDYGKCIEYRNGTKASASTPTAATTTTTNSTNTKSSAAAPVRQVGALLVRCAVGLLGAGLLWW